jgi:hypothetical protein
MALRTDRVRLEEASVLISVYTIELSILAPIASSRMNDPFLLGEILGYGLAGIFRQSNRNIISNMEPVVLHVEAGRIGRIVGA